jgi:hypothetical protein
LEPVLKFIKYSRKIQEDYNTGVDEFLYNNGYRFNNISQRKNSTTGLSDVILLCYKIQKAKEEKLCKKKSIVTIIYW